MTKKIRLSPSSLNLFAECNRCFWLRFNRGIIRPRGPFPGLPMGMDRTIKEFFDEHRTRGELPAELSGLQGAKLFNDQRLLDTWRNNFKGLRWQDKEGNILQGALDDVLERKGKLSCLDFKTKASAPKIDSAHYYELQLSVYNFLLKKNGYKVEDVGHILFYFPEQGYKNQIFRFGTNLIKVRLEPDYAEGIFKQAIQCLRGDLPEKTCEFCKYIREDDTNGKD